MAEGAAVGEVVGVGVGLGRGISARSNRRQRRSEPVPSTIDMTFALRTTALVDAAESATFFVSLPAGVVVNVPRSTIREPSLAQVPRWMPVG